MTRVVMYGCAAIAAMFLIVGCERASLPSSPSPVSLLVAPASSGFGDAVSVNVTWSCLAHGAGCPVRLHEETVVAAAATAPATPGNLTSSVTGTTVSLAWAAPSSGDQPTSYVVEAGTAPAVSNIAAFDTGGTGQSFSATSVPTGTYYVRVRAKNAMGTSAASNEVTIAVGSTGPAPAPCSGAPGAPTGLAASINGSSVTFSWAAPSGGCAATTYGIEAGSSAGATNLASFFTGNASTSYTAANVPAGTYYVRVRAGNGSAIGAASNEITVVVGGASVPGSVAGTWVGVSPTDGYVTYDYSESCGRDVNDLTLVITQNGNSISGTMTWIIKQSFYPPDVGRTFSRSITGSVNGNAINFSYGPDPNGVMYVHTGTFTSTRMTGTSDHSPSRGCQVGPFALNRQ